MKRKELLRYLMIHGCILEREDNRHSVYFNPNSNKSSTVPRHTEINTFTAFFLRFLITHSVSFRLLLTRLYNLPLNHAMYLHIYLQESI